MRKRFKARKRYSSFFSKFLLFFFLFFTSCLLSFKYLYKYVTQKLSEAKIVSYLLNTSISTQENQKITDLLNLNSTNYLVKYSLGVELSEKTILVSTKEKEESGGDYIEDPRPTKVEEPLIYLYNTHQTETYKRDFLEAYNISPTVMLTSYMLRERLNDLGVPSLVETAKITEILNKNSWNYAKSYRASRILLEDAYEKNNTLKYFIDLHRDSSKYEKTVLEYNGKTYARILFVIGLENQNYANNLILTEELNNLIKKKIPNLSRGILKKGGKGVNGIYNQDFSENCVLIEVGGQYNDIEEVKNTIDVLADVLSSYVKENHE